MAASDAVPPSLPHGTDPKGSFVADGPAGSASESMYGDPSTAASGAGASSSTALEENSRLAEASSLAGLAGKGTILRFTIEPDGFIDPVEFPLDLTVRRLRDAIAADLSGLPPTHLVIRFRGVFAHPDKTLAECGLQAGRSEEGQIMIDSNQQGDDYQMPDILIVGVRDDKTGSLQQEFRVKIERAEDSRKPYVGGFRHKKSGAVFHHAASQTPTDSGAAAGKGEGSKKPSVEKVSRDTQTVQVRSCSIQTTREAATQMERKDLLIDDTRDRVVKPGKYFSADELDALKGEKAVLIQRHWRGSLARGYARGLRDARSKEASDLAAAELRAREEAARLEAEQAERRLHPKSKKDFAVLFGEIEAWRASETARVHEEIGEAEEKQEEIARILAKETAMLQTVDRLKTQAGKEGTKTKVRKQLEAMAAPKKWELGDGEAADVHTPFTTRAKELLDLYNGLESWVGQDPQARLDVLMHTKWTVKEFDCGLTREVVELIDREADLIGRGRPTKSLKSLRKRLLNLFLQFVKTPEFNPEAARFVKVPQDLASRPHVAPIVG